MGLYKSITTPAGSTLNYWDFGIVEVNTAASEKKIKMLLSTFGAIMM